MRFKINRHDLFSRNVPTHWGNPDVLRQAYKFTHASQVREIGSDKLTLLEGKVEELNDSSTIFSIFGNTYCTYVADGYIWRTLQVGGQPELVALVSHVSGVLPTRPWISNRNVSNSTMKFINLVEAISEGYLFYKRNDTPTSAVVSAVPYFIYPWLTC